MRTVALEEHFNIPSLLARLPTDAIRARGNPSPDRAPDTVKVAAKHLSELGEARIADMDRAGISMQVLSWAGPGADLLPPREAVDWARDANDLLARAIAAHPDRFAGFAHLPVTAPDAAADELERCIRVLDFKGAMINGTTDGKFLDDPVFAPLLARAEQLDTPIYIHPNVPPKAVRDAYYDGLPGNMGFLLSTYSFGWHAEVAIHVLRLIFSGALERHRALKLIIGHMGEFLPMTLIRTDAMARTETSSYMSRTVAEQLRDQVYVTTSGHFSLPPLRVLIDTFGIDHVLFSVDYPYSTNAEAKTLLDALPLAPADAAKIRHLNADKLLKLTN